MIAIYYDRDRDTLYAGGVARAFPPKSLAAAVVGDMIEIWIGNASGRIIGPIPFSWIAAQDGSTFTSVAETKAYLDEEFSKSPIISGSSVTIDDPVPTFEAALR